MKRGEQMDANNLFGMRQRETRQSRIDEYPENSIIVYRKLG